MPSPSSTRPLSLDSGGAVTKWKRGELIGEGTFGKVYMGLNSVTGELFAVKEIEVRSSPNADDMKHVQKLEDKIALMYKLSHKHIVREDLIKIFTRQIVEGVMYLHAMGVVHRDIKVGGLRVLEAVAADPDDESRGESPVDPRLRAVDGAGSGQADGPWLQGRHLEHRRHSHRDGDSAPSVAVGHQQSLGHVRDRHDDHIAAVARAPLERRDLVPPAVLLHRPRR
ncbi:Ste/ste11 protein kinase, partial [Globisporangium splendens]